MVEGRDTREAPLSNRLATLADQAGASWRQSTEHWLTAAYTLKEARVLAAHGEWLPFLERAGIPRSTAARMVRLAGAGFKCAGAAHLGIQGADEWLARMKALKARLRLALAVEDLERLADAASTREQIEAALLECERIEAELEGLNDE
ncbi:MAG: hypothetical protein OXE57_01080 [Alphaproteobacteria bacterium]|nr:hypothetical protein [Alphaproteobacteria bacterium]